MEFLLGNNRYILVVDDNCGIRRLMCEFLTQEGYYVKEASDGLTALGLVMEEKPNLVLLDLRMPGLGGLQTADRLRDLVPETIVVIMSAYFDAQDLQKAVKEGKIKHFVIKPFELTELGVLIKDLLNNVNINQSIIS
ncbi:response regulator [Desulfosporosinus meridiei]|uniref:response regulator n=1 Tax=Desulfosporosinus meridiei TaxID=79209 RepID=UPI0005A95FD6|nr:response regulator [Desulfosporosinus meridiei]